MENNVKEVEHEKSKTQLVQIISGLLESEHFYVEVCSMNISS